MKKRCSLPYQGRPSIPTVLRCHSHISKFDENYTRLIGKSKKGDASPTAAAATKPCQRRFQCQCRCSATRAAVDGAEWAPVFGEGGRFRM